MIMKMLEFFKKLFKCNCDECTKCAMKTDEQAPAMTHEEVVEKIKVMVPDPVKTEEPTENPVPKKKRQYKKRKPKKVAE